MKVGSLLSSFSTIFFSEFGDNTWFIAFIMSMRYSKLKVFSGAMAANALMSAISAFLGSIAHVIPQKILVLISTMIFGLFGIKMIMEAYHMRSDKYEHEYKEAEEEIRKSKIGPERRPLILSYFSPIFLKSFSLTFLEEWGDRSQLTTITLGAIHDFYATTIGSILGHAFCTGLAVLLGKFSSKWLSIRTATFIGGIIFLTLAINEIIEML